jgi:hypothetical protein
MLVTDARRIVTVMQDAKSGRDRAMRALPGNAMREQHAAFAGARADDAVTIFVGPAYPEDASPIGCHADIALEPDCERDRLPCGAARFRAEFAASILDIARVDIERAAALSALARDHRHGLWGHDDTIGGR